jgi:peptidoglycan/LPS O-acetylase OafA/YrhL
MRRIKEIDGLRFLAISAVFLVHFRPAPIYKFDLMSLGWAGVDLFFAISGFLITGILISLRGQEHPFRTFYWRRTLRILPPYYAAFGITILLALTHGETLSRRDIAAASTFLLSLDRGYSFSLILGRLFSHTGFAVSAVPVAHYHLHLFRHGIGVFWSLSVEELFYLIWAPIILKGSRRTVLFSCLIPMIMCPALRALIHTAGYSEMFNFACRFDSLAAGGFVAVLFAAVKCGQISGRALDRGLLLGIPLSAVALFALAWKCGIFSGFELRSVTAFAIFGYSLLAILFAAVTGACVRWSGTVWLSFLRWDPFHRLGAISYSMYLAHIPVYVAVGIIFRDRASTYTMQVLQGCTAVLGTVVVASASWKYFESPIQQFRDRPFRFFADRRLLAPVSAGD